MNPGDFDILDLIKRTDLADVQLHDVLESTNEHARSVAEQSGGLPLLILAREQTRGRGRGARTWWSTRGSLTFSLLLEPPLPDASAGSLPALSPVTAVAIADALQGWSPPARIQLKWPNDVYLAEGKLCGILIETVPRPKRKIIVGVGVNVNNSVEAAAPPLDRPAASLIDALGHPLPLHDVLVSIVQEIFAAYRELACGSLQLVARWNPRCLLRGRRVRIRTATQRVEGICLGIDAGGGLQIDTGAGRRICRAGHVERID